MKYICEKTARVSLPVQHSDKLFPVGRVFCVGRNYAAHSREMGDDPDRDPPFFFCKDASCVVPVSLSKEEKIHYPLATSQFEYEVELVVALKSGGTNLTIEQAGQSVLGYSIGLDMTRRDLQTHAKKKGRPWEVGKSFDQSAPMSPIFLKTDELEDRLASSSIALKVNGELKQASNIASLTWTVNEVISKLSEFFELRSGDLIMTGTPDNVGSVMVGDTMEANIEVMGSISLAIID